MMTYDYKAQRWLDGEPAKQLRKVQLTEELVLLLGDRGEDFARFIGCDRQKAIEGVKKDLNQLSI